MSAATSPFPVDPDRERRYVRWFHELDAWTEYWDIYHPETQGRFYFGDGDTEEGLLRRFMPRERYPPVCKAWMQMALLQDTPERFRSEAVVPEVASAVKEVDNLVAGLFEAHFGDASDSNVQADYLEATFRFATDSLPPATERDARVADDDPRKSTAGRHMLRGDLMWFMWALQIEAAETVAGRDDGHARRALLMAGVASGCPADFAWHGHRRTREDYRAGQATARLLRARGLQWATDLDAATREVHALYRIREWGSED
jgi:hypothetical protein